METGRWVRSGQKCVCKTFGTTYVLLSAKLFHLFPCALLMSVLHDFEFTVSLVPLILTVLHLIFKGDHSHRWYANVRRDRPRSLHQKVGNLLQLPYSSTLR